MVLVHKLQLAKLKTFYEFDDSEVRVIVIDNPHTKVPEDIKKLLLNLNNKFQQVKFLCYNAFKFVKWEARQQLIISGGFENVTKCYKIEGDRIFDVIDLQSNHLEADTRLSAHAFFDLKPNSDIVIHSVDTDVFVLAIHFWPRFKAMGLSNLRFQSSNQKSRTLACHTSAEFLTPDVCEILPGLHSLTGCDTVSKVGTKKRGLDLLSHEEFRIALTPLGNGLPMTPEESKAIQKFYLRILDKNGVSVDECRANISLHSSEIGLNLAKIPCTSDALYMHSLGASVQTYIWRNAKNASYVPLDLTLFGYTCKDDSLLPKFMTKDSLPKDLIKACNCKKIAVANNAIVENIIKLV
ncbi:hypothetical protein QAD02_003583 [Eretmocerus hayati]|uniref:Uncharacterized protein n=1 Tax=Eretmocerus hayati TaxID=131215 RepID=A0ACC2NM48_9HYME|nr:hypothetical protein QAD02_003583 [Eretmocerus hayati]